jgi:hypothetical protein
MKKLVDIIVLGLIGYAAWYGYSHFVSGSPEASGPLTTQNFNCRQALATLAQETACQSSAACTLTSNEIDAMHQRERDIHENCN